MGSIWNSDIFLFKAGSLKGKSRKQIEQKKAKSKIGKKKNKVSKPLTQWEKDFLKSISKQATPLSYRQQEIMDRIKNKNNSQTI
jgi:hypothetical protein